MKCQFKKGDKVEVTDSQYSGINVGDVGEIDKPYQNGFAVKFTKPFCVQDGSCQKIIEQTRFVWFRLNQIKHHG